MNTSLFYVYELIDPRNNVVFYVGKGTGYRHTSHISESKRHKIAWTNALKCERIQSIIRLGFDVVVRKVHEHLTELEAYNLERLLIEKYGLLIHNTGTLTNIRVDGVGVRRSDAKRTVRSIIQYDMNGNMLQTFVSASAAANYTNIRISGILKCCNGVRGHAGNFRWGYEGIPLKQIGPIEYHVNRRKRVNQYDSSGMLIATHSSILEAATVCNVSSANIVACCKQYKHALTIGGFRWTYAT